MTVLWALRFLVIARFALDAIRFFYWVQLVHLLSVTSYALHLASTHPNMSKRLAAAEVLIVQSSKKKKPLKKLISLTAS